MKKFLKVLTCTLLVISMVLTGLPALPELEFDGSGLESIKLKLGGIAQAFASSKTDVDRTGYTENQNQGTESATGSPNAARRSSDTDTYILAVSMYKGATADVCKYIIIKYYASEEAKSQGIISTQYLSPSASNIFGEDIVSGSGFINGDYGFIGSKKTSFSNFADNAEWIKAYYNGSDKAALDKLVGSSGTSYVIGENTYIKAFSQYQSWAKTVTGASDSDAVFSTYKPVSEKISSTALQAASTDYFRFKFEYGFYELEDLEFYCEANSDDAGASFSFGINSWTLYKHDGEFDSNGNFVTGSTRLINYAFLSDSIGLCFNGTRLYESVSFDEDDKSTYDYPDTREIIGEGAATLTFKNVDEINGKYFEYNNGFSNIYFFRKCTENTKVSADSSKILNFGIRIADMYGAGIDSFSHAKNFAECLTAIITYKDTGGNEQMVGLPVITNALLEFAIPIDEDPYNKNSVYEPVLEDELRIDKLASGKYLSFAQESDTVYFSVEFPDFGSLVSIEFDFEPTDENDELTIAGVDVYDNCGNTQFAVRHLYIDNTTDQSAIDITLPTVEAGYSNGAQVLYRNTAETNYGTMNLDNNTYIMDFASSDKVTLPETSYTSQYLITLHTEDISTNQCSDELYYSFTYEDLDGKTKTTELSSLKEAVNDFYGYSVGEMTTSGKDLQGNEIKNKVTQSTDAQYYYCTSPNQDLQFILYAKDVSSFKSMSLTFAGPDVNIDDVDASSIWQMDRITIEKLYNQSVVGKRISRAVDTTVALSHYMEGYSRVSDRTLRITQTFDRSVEGTDVIYDSGTLASAEEGKVHALYAVSPKINELYYFETSSTKVDSANESEDVDTDLKNGMSYADALKDKKMGEARVTYTVQVDVSGNKEATRTDDCGSNNHFYFQLLFAEKGDAHQSSGYVLANQQLSADGFRSGYTESFDISVNELVGDVTGINIIVDSTYDGADMDDKLKIDTITVVKNSDNNIDKCFVIENIGWLNVEFGESANVASAETKSASELEQYFGVSYTTYMLELEFAITWGNYTSSTSSDDEIGVFQGNLIADIRYSQSDDGEKSTPKTLSSIQCVALMAEYCGRTAQSDDTLTYVSDTSYMFVAQHTNRFIVPIKGVSSITSIRFTAYADGYSSEHMVPFKSMSVFINKEVGAPRLALNGDILRNYSEGSQVLYCDKYSPSLTQGYQLTAMADADAGAYHVVFKFVDCSEIPEYKEGEDTISSVNRVPASSNDKLNVYIYLEAGTPGPNADDYTLSTTIEYTLSNSINYASVDITNQLQERQVVDESGQTVTVLYATGIAASKIAGISNITLKAPKLVGTNKQSYQVSHCIIQQTRGDTIIDTYKCTFSTKYFGMFSRGTNMLGGASSKNLGYTQTVQLQLASDTFIADLVAEKYDIAVALEYTTLIAGQTDTVYVSPYTFATDSGVDSIHPGSIIEFNFCEAYVGDIKAIKVYAMNGLQVKMRAAVIKTYLTTEVTDAYLNTKSVTTQTEMYSISMGDDYTTNQDVSEGIVEIEVPASGVGADTVDSLKRANLSFSIMDDELATVIDSAGSTKVRATVAYQTILNQKKTITIPDITQYTVDGKTFEPGETAEVSLFLAGASDLLYLVLEPYDDDETITATLNLRSVTFQMDDVKDTAKHTTMVGDTIYEDTPLTINLSKIAITLDVEYILEGFGTQTVSVTNDTAEIVVNEDSFVYITPTILNDSSNSGYVVRTYEVLEGSRMLISDYATDNEVFKFKATNGTSSNITWLIEISAATIPTDGTVEDTKTNSIKSYVQITVMPTGTKTEAEETTEEAVTPEGIEYSEGEH